MTASADFIAGLPKAEIHLHIEGTLSIDLKRQLAARNGLDLGPDSFKPLAIPPGTTGQALDIAQYKMFLGLYNEGLKVLHTPEDFRDVMTAYLDRCAENGIRHTEIFFDPQAHTARGVPFTAVIEGLAEGQAQGLAAHGITSALIMCAHRDRSLDEAMAMLDAARPHRDRILGLGLDNIEDGHPPVKFRQLYDAARGQGYRLTAHCDVDMVNAPEHVRQCLEEIRVERIDHGLNVMDDARLVDVALERGVHFTACPTWRDGDPGPRRVARIQAMRARGLPVSMHTDDPGYFASGYMNHMLEAVAQDVALSAEDLAEYQRDAFRAAWIDDDSRARHLAAIDAYLAQWQAQTGRTA